MIIDDDIILFIHTELSKVSSTSWLSWKRLMGSFASCRNYVVQRIERRERGWQRKAKQIFGALIE